MIHKEWNLPFELTLGLNERFCFFQNQKSYKLCSDNPQYSLTVFTPTIRLDWNKSEEYSYSASLYNLQFSATSHFGLTHSDLGTFWRIHVRLLGFGFDFSRQSAF